MIRVIRMIWMVRKDSKLSSNKSEFLFPLIKQLLCPLFDQVSLKVLDTLIKLTQIDIMRLLISPRLLNHFKLIQILYYFSLISLTMLILHPHLHEILRVLLAQSPEYLLTRLMLFFELLLRTGLKIRYLTLQSGVISPTIPSAMSWINAIYTHFE